jgi:antitoxin component of RelBE/YafQ-DinJ toxin-antitoxin module
MALSLILNLQIMSKDKLISFKIEEETKESFERICKENFTTVSQTLYKFVHKEIKQESKNSKASK